MTGQEHEEEACMVQAIASNQSGWNPTIPSLWPPCGRSRIGWILIEYRGAPRSAGLKPKLTFGISTIHHHTHVSLPNCFPPPHNTSCFSSHAFHENPKKEGREEEKNSRLVHYCPLSSTNTNQPPNPPAKGKMDKQQSGKTKDKEKN